MFFDTLNFEKRCVVIGAAPEFYGSTLIRPDDFVIVCDGGYAHAKAGEIRVDLWVGDSDSCVRTMPDGDFEKIRLPREKDDTDLLFAVKCAQERGYRNFLLLAALGGRIDHMLGNFAVGARIAESGGICALIGRFERIFIFKDNSLALTRTPDAVISLLPLGDRLGDVTLTGFHYPLSHADLVKEFPIGISNRFDGSEKMPVVCIGNGTALVTVRNDAGADC